ncbi:MAG: alpha/beta hydrolase [Clostridia bacterium]|nr:alpha/beta hydrolase [Clostridia bacterium]
MGEGKCLVFLHGWGGEIASFRTIADRLASRFRVILPDMYGFGRTPHPSHPLTLDDYAEGIRELLRKCGADDVVLVGHSFGGRVAMRIAAKDPDVAGLVLIDSAGVPPRRGLCYYLKVAAYKLGKKLHLKHLPKGSADYAALSGVMKKTFINVVNESNLEDAGRITLPTLLLWGREDKDTPLYMCRKLKKAILGSEVILLDGGHFAYLSNAGLVTSLLRAFRDRV